MKTLLVALVLALLAVWLYLFVALLGDSGVSEPAVEVEAVVSSTSTTTATTSTTTTTTAPPTTTTTAVPRPPSLRRSISSTMYCEQGRMANGELVHDGAVSSKVLPRGSVWRVVTGPFAGRLFTVKDTGSLAYFDMWTASCDEAIRYGRRTIEIEAA